LEAGTLEAGDAQPSATARERPWFELRRSDLLGPAQIEVVRELHQNFVRAVARAVGNALRTLARGSCTEVDQRPYRSFARGMPASCIVAPIDLEPLQGTLVVALPGETALCLVDRLVGGPGLPCPPRAPTELELLLIADFLRLLLPPLTEAFEPVAVLRPSLTAIEINPTLIRAIPAADMTVVLTFALAFPGAEMPPVALTLCYPVSVLRSAFELLSPAPPPEPAAAPTVGGPSTGVAAQLAQVGVELCVHLTPTAVPAGDIVGLSVGDVLRLDHKTDEPALGAVRGRDLLCGSVGRRGERLGFRVSAWRSDG
jgi:flagellar motor switch protein FliM